jgi:mannose-6-phosphate isomerase-like protein (cupin superfamily)
MDAPQLGAVTRADAVVEFLPVQLDGRQVGVLSAESGGPRDEWEMHPEQDELFYLVEAAIDVFLRADLEGFEEDTLHVRQGQACLIPKGMWHRQVVVAPCKMLFITPRDDPSGIYARIRMEPTDRLIPTGLLQFAG